MNQLEIFNSIYMLLKTENLNKLFKNVNSIYLSLETKTLSESVSGRHRSVVRN